MITRRCSVDRFLKLYPDACYEAKEWLRKGVEKGRFRTMGEAWDVCHRGGWMVWVLRSVYGGNVFDMPSDILSEVNHARIASHNSWYLEDSILPFVRRAYAREIRKRFDFVNLREVPKS